VCKKYQKCFKCIGNAVVITSFAIAANPVFSISFEAGVIKFSSFFFFLDFYKFGNTFFSTVLHDRLFSFLPRKDCLIVYNKEGNTSVNKISKWDMAQMKERCCLP
jgi:hypothetical protein